MWTKVSKLLQKLMIYILKNIYFSRLIWYSKFSEMFNDTGNSTEMIPRRARNACESSVTPMSHMSVLKPYNLY